MKDLERLYDYTLETYGVDIKKDTNEWEVTDYRAFFYLVAQKYTRYNEKKIGRFVGRNRSTVNNGATQMISRTEVNPELARRYSEYEIGAREYIKSGLYEVKRTPFRIERDMNYHLRMAKYFQKQLNSI